ncbi:MAG: type II secretion system F family protein [Bacilli bacterium]|nr:type II secretion system F family protein [Bacilli bacterium]
MYKNKKNGRCIGLRLDNVLKSAKKVPSSIKDMPSVFVWYFFKFCISIYRFFKYVWYGLLWPIILVAILFSKYILNKKTLDVDKLRRESQRLLEKEREKEEKLKQKLSNEIDTSSYKNKNIKIEKKNFGYYINLALTAILEIPVGVKKRIDNIALVKQARNKKAFDTKTMLVDFASEADLEEQNKGKRITWEYIAINEKGKKIKGYFDAYSKVDVQSFLLGEGLTPYSIRTSKLIQTLYGSIGGNRTKIKNKDLIFLLTQLSTYIKSGIPLVDSLNILNRQVQKKSYKKILRDATYDLTVGESFSAALEKRGPAFPKLLINMVKASELTGELPEALDDMVNYYTETEEARKEMISALTYPSIVFIFTLIVVTFVMMYVVPKFVDIYNTMDSSAIPKFTLIVINISNFLEENIVEVILVAVLILLLIVYLYKNVKVIRTIMQWIFMHIPVIKDVIIYNEVTMFSKTFASLLSHNVYITDSMDILNRVTNNEIYKIMILDTVANLARGDKISAAFKDQWSFPVPAYEMIVTGEKTGQLAEMMSKVSTYYQSLHKNTVSRIKALVEPILIIFLTFAVGAILLAVIVPMFNMYSQVQGMGG